VAVAGAAQQCLDHGAFDAALHGAVDASVHGLLDLMVEFAYDATADDACGGLYPAYEYSGVN
jgi:hypothetical protein